MTSASKDPNLETFLFSAVHDMKNSIAVLAASMEHHLSQTDLTEHPIYRDMGLMFYEVKRMTGNLTHVLTLYKLGLSDFPFYLDEYSLEGFARDVLGFHTTLLHTMNISVDSEVEPDLVWAYDEYLMTNVISQAINNAMKYTKDQIRLVIKEVDGMLEIRVEDNGQGYPAKMLDCPVGDLHRGEFINSGTGLGLYFAAVVAKLHQNGGKVGHVRLENGGSLGGGCFVVCLP